MIKVGSYGIYVRKWTKKGVQSAQSRLEVFKEL